MSHQNMEIVRRFLTHVNEQDLAAALSCVAPAAELDWSDSDAPDSGRYRGPDGWGEWITGRWEGLEDARFDVADLVDVPPDTVLLVEHMSGRGRVSGLETKALGAGVITVANGMISGLRLYQTREQALRALGLAG